MIHSTRRDKERDFEIQKCLVTAARKCLFARTGREARFAYRVDDVVLFTRPVKPPPRRPHLSRFDSFSFFYYLAHSSSSSSPLSLFFIYTFSFLEHFLLASNSLSFPIRFLVCVERHPSFWVRESPPLLLAAQRAIFVSAQPSFSSFWFTPS